MAISSSWLLFFIFLLLGCGVLELEASHVYRNLQDSQSTSDKQPYRTSYHFQPPKNWMNGMCWLCSPALFSFSVCFLNLTVIIVFIVRSSNNVLFGSCFCQCDMLRWWIGQMGVFGYADPNGKSFLVIFSIYNVSGLLKLYKFLYFILFSQFWLSKFIK